MKGKNYLVLAVASLLGAVALAGCNNQNDTDSKATTTPSSSSSSESTPAPAELADGAYSYVNADSEERTKILGALEKWAVDQKLTGLTLFNSGGYVMYNPNIVKGTNSYIKGYGFGILAEGDINSDLEGETKQEWKRYYHSFQTDDPSYLNYMNDKGSVVGGLQSYVNAAYFTTRMTETKDDYEWVGDLATVNRPEALNASATTGLATKYRFPVKVGADLKYTTLSTKYASYNNREVQLEDYVTPYKIYYTKAYGMARGSENLSGTGSIRGASSYYNASAAGFNEAKWNNIGIKAYEEGGKSYLEFEFNKAVNPFFAMYYLSSEMFAPVPEAFIKEIGGGDFAQGVKNWGANSEDLSESVLDHWLATGAYTVEAWNKDQEIVFKKNPNYDDKGRYKIQGVHLNILPGANTDPEVPLNEFLANKLSATSIPYTKLSDYITDSRTTTTIGESNFKLNLNTCDQETWVDLFGENGSIAQTDEEDYWACEPAMSNKDFVSGLSFAIDRVTLAKKVGNQPAFEYFSPTYLIDPENGVYYNETDAHKEAVKSLQEGTDGYGYSLELAKQAFKKSSEQLIAEGKYKAGDTIEIEIAWMYASDEDQYHGDIAKNLMDAFNVDDNPLKLDVKFWVGQQWSDVYYKKLMTGQFDLGFGSISGNTYDPLNFFEVLKSDNSSQFTLNWGIDTNAVTGEEDGIVYDGKVWSFDALWTAADQGAYVQSGKNAQVETDFDNYTAVRNTDGTVTLKGDFLELDVEQDGEVAVKSRVSNINIYAYNIASEYDLPVLREDFEKCERDEESGYTHIEVTFPAFACDAVGEIDQYAAYGYVSFDVYYTKEVFGSTSAEAIAGSIFMIEGMPETPTEASVPITLY